MSRPASRPARVAYAALLVAVALAIPRAAFAHPGIGIVMDKRGNVFYTDLAQVWRIAPDGHRTVAVKGVHTHELSFDEDGNLYGEHLWYEGEATDRWGHYVWRLRPDGVLDTIVGPRAGFRTPEISFVRDSSGTSYWVDPEKVESIQKLGADGVIAVHARHPLRRVGWMHAAPDGTLYLMDEGDLLRVSPSGEVTTLVAGLAKRSRMQPHVSQEHAIMGLWSDGDGNVYVASYATREVKLVTSRGMVSVVRKSGLGWGPTGGLVAPNGDLWVLESSVTNAVRVRRFARNGKEDEWR